MALLEGRRSNNNLQSEYYLRARDNLTILGSLGFHIKKAGITVPVKAKDLDLVVSRLTEILGRDMSLVIPHFFLKQTPPKDKRKLGYITRSITSSERNGEEGSIVEEQIVPQEISQIAFKDQPPFCLYNKPKGSDRVGRHFIYEIDRVQGDYLQANVNILAGIGKSLPEIRYGFDVMILVMMAMGLVEWRGKKNFDNPLFFITTARLTNEMKDSKPAAYLLNRLYEDLGLEKKWLGLAVVHRMLVRDHSTGGVIVKITPSDYEDVFQKVRIKFNQSVEKMRSANPTLF
jgi:hypothetical protein